ncbi:uncharacterized protein HMPREF1541_01084 [Cyphellophora europaea CBS 101466]|uniref:Uncharacterized protein n=1 Tax=Cyphellophora europaea (strain CBS 101466) TaxID=1220924 RepID=W2SE63_CYPE1|nr:uncharacterized protein HMPREF1541_01084 [Cyphellophora europaea CBS 101466]ETN46895.1 hypothetical protein HMPREF1541_01084 [Cyphellophora europaea CBS 101466]
MIEPVPNLTQLHVELMNFPFANQRLRKLANPDDEGDEDLRDYAGMVEPLLSMRYLRGRTITCEGVEPVFAKELSRLAASCEPVVNLDRKCQSLRQLLRFIPTDLYNDEGVLARMASEMTHLIDFCEIGRDVGQTKDFLETRKRVIEMAGAMNRLRYQMVYWNDPGEGKDIVDQYDSYFTYEPDYAQLFPSIRAGEIRPVLTPSEELVRDSIQDLD